MPKVTSIESLKKYTQGEIVSLPGFIEGETFNVRLKRPSILTMLRTGKIPNILMATANEMFAGSKSSKEVDVISNIDNINNMYQLCTIVAESAMVEPTYKDLQDIGLELTEEQLTSIFNYVQTGVKELEPFRPE